MWKMMLLLSHFRTTSTLMPLLHKDETITFRLFLVFLSFSFLLFDPLFWIFLLQPKYILSRPQFQDGLLNDCLLGFLFNKVVFFFFFFFFFLNIGFTLDLSMIEIVFIHPFELCELFYKYNSSLGMAALFTSAFIRPQTWQLVLYSIHKT